MLSLRSLEPFLIAANQARLDAQESLKEKAKQTTTKELFNLEAVISWQPQGHFCCDNAMTPERELRGFLPGASVFLCLRQWASTLEWPDHDDESTGISNYELICHFVGTTACTLPRVCNRGVRLPHYVDPDRDSTALLLPFSPWDAVRIWDAATHFAQKFLSVHLVPPHAEKAQRPFLSAYGYKKVLTGYRLRPNLPRLVEHISHFRAMVGTTELAIPKPYDLPHVGVRVPHSLDTLDYDTRVRAWQSLHNAWKRRKDR
eukprot:Skav228886  [mRNA]  locus=scaffold194:33573:34349:- [translate_table: standard]